MRRGLTAALLLVAGEAAAQRLPGLAFEWRAPPACPTREAVLRQVADARGRDPGPGDRALDVDVTVSQRGRRWRAEIRTRSGAAQGERALEAGSCNRLAQGVALVIALAMDEAPAAPEASPPPPPPPVLFIDDGELPPALRPRRRPPATPRGSRVTFGLTARAGVDAGLLPSPSPGVFVGGLVRAGVFEARLELGAFAARDGEGPRAGTSVAAEAQAAQALACLRFAPGAAELGGCTGVEAALVAAWSRGFAQDARDERVAVGVPLRVWAGVRVARGLTVSLAPEVLFPVTRLRYEVRGVGAVHELPLASFRGGLAASFTWP